MARRCAYENTIARISVTGGHFALGKAARLRWRWPSRLRARAAASGCLRSATGGPDAHLWCPDSWTWVRVGERLLVSGGRSLVLALGLLDSAAVSRRLLGSTSLPCRPVLFRLLEALNPIGRGLTVEYTPPRSGQDYQCF